MEEDTLSGRKKDTLSGRKDTLSRRKDTLSGRKEDHTQGRLQQRRRLHKEEGPSRKDTYIHSSWC